MTTTPGHCPVSVEGSAASDELGGVVADQTPRRASGDHAEAGERPGSTITAADLLDGLHGRPLDSLDGWADIEDPAKAENQFMRRYAGQIVDTELVHFERVDP